MQLRWDGEPGCVMVGNGHGVGGNEGISQKWSSGHCVGDVEFSRQNVPATHSVINAGVLHADPAGQGCGSVLPIGQCVPFSHGLAVDGFGQLKDGGQARWVVEPSGQ